MCKSVRHGVFLTILGLVGVATLCVNIFGTGQGSYGVRSIYKEAIRQSETWHGTDSRIAVDYLDDLRQLVQSGIPKYADVGILTENETSISTTERFSHIVTAFELCPAKVDRVGDFEMFAYDAILLPWGAGQSNTSDFEAMGFEKKGETLAWELWVRTDIQTHGSRGEDLPCDKTTSTPIVEILGLLPLVLTIVFGAVNLGWTGALLAVVGWIVTLWVELVCGLTGCVASCVAGSFSFSLIVFLRKFVTGGFRDNFSEQVAMHSYRNDMFSAFIAITWTLFATALALSHTLTPPNGLGVSGGRAALWLTCGGIPSDFFSDPAFETFQPTYPPGMALLTLGAWGVSGAPGVWLTQLLALAPFAALLWLFLLRARNIAVKMWILALFLTPIALNMASLFYSEGWMLLFITVGILILFKSLSIKADGMRQVFVAWFLIGFAGMFKNEGLVFSALLWFVMRYFRGKKAAPVLAVVVGFMPSLIWWAYSRFCGGVLPDYAPIFWSPNPGRFLLSLRKIFHEIFLAPWGSGFSWWIAILAILVGILRWCWRRISCKKFSLRAVDQTASSAKEAVAFLLLCIPAFAFIYSLSLAHDFDWHMWSSLPRLLWDAAVIATALSLLSISTHCHPSNVRQTTARRS